MFVVKLLSTSGPYPPSSLLVYTGRVASSVVELVAGSCSRTPPRRSVWITRPVPSGSTSKPIGSLRFGGAATNDCE